MNLNLLWENATRLSRMSHGVNLVPDCYEDLGIIFEGQLMVQIGLTWWSGHWKLAWRDEGHTHAALIRFGKSSDPQPIYGKMNNVALSIIKTLVVMNERDVGIDPINTLMLSAERFCFALQTLDGSTLMLAAATSDLRLQWMAILYSTLVCLMF